MWQKELGLSEKVQVVMGLPDVHSAAIGSGRGARLCGASLHRHVVVARLPRSV